MKWRRIYYLLSARVLRNSMVWIIQTKGGNQQHVVFASDFEIPVKETTLFIFHTMCGNPFEPSQRQYIILV